jgi:uncharacterized protein (DUF2384 family)
MPIRPKKQKFTTPSGRAVAAAAHVVAPACPAKPRASRTTLVSLPEVVRVKRVPDRDVPGRLERLVNTFGHNQTAALLAARSQLSRCTKGTEKISAELECRIIDLDFVITRALQVMHADEVGPWLLAPEPLLGNAVPLNVLRLSGPARVIAALDSIRAGAFA